MYVHILKLYRKISLILTTQFALLGGICGVSIVNGYLIEDVYVFPLPANTVRKN